jgi:transposase
VPDVAPDPDDAVALRAVIEAKDTEIAALREQVGALTAQVTELRARLGQNPRNSSKPPSSEGLARSAPKSLRKKSGRRPGRPKGQPGATLQMTGDPGEVVSHEPGACRGCGAGLFGAEVTGTERRQVTDLPGEIRAEVTEHRLVSRRCSCGTVTTPAGVPYMFCF